MASGDGEHRARERRRGAACDGRARGALWALCERDGRRSTGVREARLRVSRWLIAHPYRPEHTNPESSIFQSVARGATDPGAKFPDYVRSGFATALSARWTPRGPVSHERQLADRSFSRHFAPRVSAASTEDARPHRLWRICSIVEWFASLLRPSPSLVRPSTRAHARPPPSSDNQPTTGKSVPASLAASASLAPRAVSAAGERRAPRATPRAPRAPRRRLRRRTPAALKMPPSRRTPRVASAWRSWRTDGSGGTGSGHRCHYISAGEDNDGPIVVLVHGFGAHSYHWRYTVPALARRGFRVYALCMLGYGWSPKVEEPYSMEYWGSQVIDFVAQVAGASESDRAVVAGNSIGALAALYAASRAPHQTRGLCLVNSAGNFAEGAAPGPEKKTLAQRAVGQTAPSIRDPTDPDPPPYTLAERVQESFGRLVATGIFYFTKVRIKSILQQVYEYEVDDELAKSIAMAAEDPGAIGTFYQLSLAGGRTEVAAGELLEKFEGPLMLLWGEKDPWMTPTKAERIMEIKPDAYYAPVVAGHCPHDDAPTECSAKLADWAEALPA